MPTQLQSSGNKYNGIYRAKVVDVDFEEDNEKNKYGAIKVFVPDIHISEISGNDENTGIIAYPGNFSFGGYNSEDTDEKSFFGIGGIYIPEKNSYVNVRFEGGNLDRCYYLGPWVGTHSPLPPENINVDEPHKVYTIFKSGMGRSIIICDSTDQQRVEITGKKRKLNSDEGPAGNKESIYEIDDNQTTIFLDEREGSEKLLIRTYKGDYINLDIEEQTLNFSFKGDINIKTEGSISMEAGDGINIKATNKMAISSKNMDIKSEMLMKISTGVALFIKATGNVFINGAVVLINSCVACYAAAAAKANPKGDR